VVVEVVTYNAAWPVHFTRMRQALEAALGGVEIRSIEHVGSTSVPGLAAKPVLDIDVVVPRGQLGAAISALVAAGYEHRGDLGIPDRHAMRAPSGGIRRNVYVVVEGSLALRNHLAVRGALRTDATLRRRYGALKRQLARDVDHIDDYVEGKSGLLTEILTRAGFTPSELNAIRAANPSSQERRGAG
jgi:GrpB-like predicted nucleotidyltransferase (UPF0157 family)